MSESFLDYLKVSDPTLSVDQFENGDAVFCSSVYNDPAYGIVIDKSVDAICMRIFENGSPDNYWIPPEYGWTRKEPLENALNHFNGILQLLEEKFRKGGLLGVIAARKQYFLERVVEKIVKSNKPWDRVYAANAYINSYEPKTGIYVLRGSYAGQGPDKYMEAIKVTPRLSEELVNKVMVALHPDGFHSIPKEVRNTPATSHGDLVGYWAYEAPEKAIPLIKKLHNLELKTS